MTSYRELSGDGKIQNCERRIEFEWSEEDQGSVEEVVLNISIYEI